MEFSGLRYRTLHWLATLVYRLAWPIVILSFVLAGASIYFGVTKLKFSGNPNDLLRSDAAYHHRYMEYTRLFRAEEDYVIVVNGPEFEKNRQCVEFIAAKLKEQPELFKKIFYHIDLKELAEQRGLLFLDLPQLQEIETGIDDFSSMMGKDQFQLDLNSLLEVASSKFDPKYMRKRENEKSLDAFAEQFVDSLTALADRLEGKTGLKPVKFGDFLAQSSDLQKMKNEAGEHEYLSLESGKILLLQVPSPNQEASFGDHDYIITPMKKIIAQARQQFPGIEIGLTGEPALSEDQAQSTQHDSMVSSIATFILIALLFGISFREFSRPALALLTLILAVCWTIGFTTLAVGRLNILSMAFIPMILGLGIDFGIQILGRYEEELPKNPDVIGALTHTIMNTGNAIITGASTTAFAFYTMCWNEFTGLSEMGLIGGTGILLCVLGSLVLLPALLAIRDRNTEKQHIPKSQQYEGRTVAFFDRVILEKPWVIICLSAVITGFAIHQIPKIWFDYNLLNLQNADLESVRFEHRLLHSQDSHSVIFAASLCDTPQEARIRADKFKKLTSVVQEVISITEMVPENQEPKLKEISKIKRKLENVSLPSSGVKVNVPENIRVLKTLRTNCANIMKLAQKWASREDAAEATKFFTRIINAMDRCLKVLESMGQDQAEHILTSYQTQLFSDLRKNLDWLKSQKVDRPITEADIPQDLRERYVSSSGKILIEVYPKEDIWDRQPLSRFVEKLRTVDPQITGTPVQNYEYIELLKTSYEKAAVYALIAIIILITLHFRTPKYILPTLLPLTMGIIWTAGLMPVVGLAFNPANIITLPLVIGIGVAFGVYAVDRYRENRSPALFSTSTGKSIFLSALTVIFGFGSLGFAGDPSLASLGKLMTIGVSMCLITSLYVCPAILHVVGRRQIEAKK